MYPIFNGIPLHGTIKLIGSVIGAGYFFFFERGSFRYRRPTLHEKFQSGTANDVEVLIGLGMIILIGYCVAVMISDIRSTGRWW